MRRILPLLAITSCAPAPPVVEVEEIPTVVSLSWERDWSGEAWVEYGLDGQLDHRTDVLVSDTSHLASLYGLKAGRTYAWRAVQVRESGREVEVGRGEIEIDPPPPDLVRLDVAIDHAGPEGFFLTSQVAEDSAYVLVVDRDGDPVWWYSPQGRLLISSVGTGIDGESFVFTANDQAREEDLGATWVVSLDGASVLSTRTRTGHHDFAQTPEGTVLWLGYETLAVDIAGEEVLVAGDVVLESPLGASGSDQTREIYSFFDDWPFGVRPYNKHFWSAHFGEPAAADWTHCNSLMYDAPSDSITVLCKNLDQLLRIDRASGELLWTTGPNHTDLEPTGEPANLWWSQPHMSQLLPQGALVFDNSYDTLSSRVVEYHIDPEAGTIALEWQYVDPGERFVTILGDARRLDSGNTLVSWGALGLLTEVTPGGEVVWQAEAGLGQALGRVRYFERFEDLPPE